MVLRVIGVVGIVIIRVTIRMVVAPKACHTRGFVLVRSERIDAAEIIRHIEVRVQNVDLRARAFLVKVLKGLIQCPFSQLKGGPKML